MHVQCKYPVVLPGLYGVSCSLNKYLFIGTETVNKYIYNPGQNKLGHWQIFVFSSCFLKYRGENTRLEPSHPPSPLIQCWDGRMAFDSTNIETGGAGGTESKTEVVQFCDLSQEF